MGIPAGIDAAVMADRAPLDPPGRPHGGCLCGTVSYVVEGEPIRAMSCHCGRCRTARSAAHGSNLFTNADGVRFTRGADRLTTYKLPEPRFFSQVFCPTCGAKMPRVDRERGLAIIPMSGLDDHPGMCPQRHILIDSKAPWFEVADALPRHAEHPPSA